MPVGFTHLHLHSSYSLLDGAVRLKELIPTAQKMGFTSLAITDHGNMYGAVEFYKMARKAGIKPILGCEVYVAPGERRDKTKRGAYHLILLAKSNVGYLNLINLVSKAHLQGFYYRPRIDKELLGQFSEGLIGLSACLGGEIPKAFREGGPEKAKRVAAEYRDLFDKDSFYLEIQSNGYPEQEALNPALRSIGSELGIPLVATNDVHYLRASDAAAHEILMCIQTGHTLDDPKRTKMHSDDLFLRSAEQMLEAMPEYADALEQTLEIAERCNVELDLSSTYLPDYELPEGYTPETYLTELSQKGLELRFEQIRREERNFNPEEYRERLKVELDIILRMDYAGYFLIVWDFIKEAKSRGIPVGPGRGSGAGSVVAWALRITELDPIYYNLLFERFLNPERVSMPDFDVDFCKNRRDEVIRYVVDKYGVDRVGQIATFHQLKTRSVTRDVGRAMGMPFGDVDKVAKLLPEPGPATAKITIPQAIQMEPKLKELYETDTKVKTLLDFAERLEGLHRHVGMHAGGVVIGRKPLWEHVPVFGESGKMVTQYDKDYAEECGLVKFDFLGLKTMTILDIAAELVNRRPDRDEPIDLLELPLDDKKTYELIASGDTAYVFQMESKGFRDLIKRLAPDRFEEIVALLALYRPGPLEGGMVDDFVERKHGRQKITYFHENLEPVLNETFGIIVYQEQVMQAARVLAGFTLGSADIMRRAMGKKKVDVMAEQRRLFVEGCEKKGITEAKATEVFDLIDKFAGYGFNKSHSAAYALVSFQTAYLKAHYPVEFLAANLTCDSDDTDRVAFLIGEGRAKGIEILQPDINESEVNFTVLFDSEGIGRIRFGLGALKGVGQAGLESVIEARKDGMYRDLFDFCARVDLRRVNKGMLETLIKGGAFDSVGEAHGIDRARTMAALESAIERGKAEQRDRESGQGSLFDLLGDSSEDEDAQVGAVEYPQAEPWDDRRSLQAERESLGFYLTGHPLNRYKEEVRSLSDVTVEKLATRVGKKARLCGVVEGYRERPLKNGNGRLAIFQLEDLTGRVEVFCPSRVFERVAPVLQQSDPIVCEAFVQLEGSGGEDEEPRLRLENAIRLLEWRQQRYTEVHLCVKVDEITHEQLSAVRELLTRHPGRCQLYLKLERPGAWETVLSLPDRFRCDPNDQMLGELEHIIENSRLHFRC